MSTILISSTTANRPLVIVCKNAKNMLTAKKFWHVVTNKTPENILCRTEEIWYSQCVFSKHNSFNESNFPWSSKKLKTPKNTAVALLEYNTQESEVVIRSMRNIPMVRKTAEVASPEELTKCFEFAINPAHQFSYKQSQVIQYQLRGAISPDLIKQFVMLYPNAEAPYNPEEPDIPNNPPAYPSTVLEAYQLLTGETPINATAHIQYEPPTLQFVDPPTSQPFVIPNMRPTNFRNGRTMPVGTYHLSLHITQEGKHNCRREVFYADNFPMSPLKSTVAILYINTNPNSATFNQPIVKSINIANSTEAEIEDFLTAHGEHLTNQQRAQFHTQPKSLHNHPAPGETNAMSIAHSETPCFCAECGAEFLPTRSTSRFCDEPCRTAFYSKGRRKSQQHAQHAQPQSLHQPAADAVTREEFQALSQQMSQILNLLTTKA